MSRIAACGVVALATAAALAAPAAATPPGRNGALIWQRESRSGPPKLWVANPDGSAARPVFSGGPRRAEFEGTFSPTDPALVLFSRGTRRPFSEDIFAGNLVTGAVTRVTSADSADIAPTVSPDGRRIVYFGVPRPRRIDPNVPPPPGRLHVAAIDGTGDRILTAASRDSFDPDWSPDGTRIVYAETRQVRRNRFQNRLAVINVDGSGRRVLTAFGGADEVNPKWMPDGRTIVFERLKRTGNLSDIVSMSAAGGGPHEILATPAWETNPIPSPDGTRIAFTSDRDQRGRDRLGPGTEVYTMALDGTGIVRVTDNRAPDVFPDWQRLG